MPSFQVMLERLNQITTADKLAAYKKKFGSKPPERMDFLKSFARTDFERQFASSVPPGMRAALRGLLINNLERDVPLTVTWAWKPAYDFELTFWECEDTSVSKGGITILIGTRYPRDPHPGDIGKPKRGAAGVRRASRSRGRRRARAAR